MSTAERPDRATVVVIGLITRWSSFWPAPL